MKFINKENRSLLMEMVRTDFKLRYQGSVLGYLWSLLKPLLLFGVLYVVFARFLRFGEGIPNFAVSLLLAMVLWTFFTEATNNGLTSIVTRGDLIRKINIPKYMIILSSASSAFINLFFNLIVIFVFMLISGVGLSWSALWMPLIVLELFILSVAVSFLFSAAYVKYRDVTYIWEVAQNALFYTVPIIYPISMIPFETVKELIVLNPIAQIIQDARYALTYQGTVQTYDLHSFAVSLIPFALVILVTIISSWYFKKEAPYFAENL